MKKIKNLEDLFIEQAREQVHGERQLLEAFPKMRAEASSDELRTVIDQHIGKIKTQISRLEKVFNEIARNQHGEENKAVAGLLEEALDIIERSEDDEVRDAAIITSIQHLNHNNIASYGTLSSYAELLEWVIIGQWLHDCLEEEKTTDSQLIDVAKEKINQAALT